jgi:hypothetical protein
MAYRRILAPIADLIVGADRLVLTADVANGVNTITVENIISVSTNNILMIGEPGSEGTEIIGTSSSITPSGYTVTLAANLSESHPSGTVIYIIRANQVQFFWAATQFDPNQGGGLTSLAAAKNIDPTSVNNHFDDTSQSSGFYYYQFSDSINNVQLLYSSGIPWEEQAPKYNPNQVGFLLASTARKLVFDWSERFSKDDAINEINECLGYIDGSQLHWPRHFVEGAVLGQLTMGGFELALPSNIYDPNTNRSIYQIYIAGQVKPLQYVDDREFKVYMDDSVFSTIRTQTNIGDPQLNVVNSDNFPNPGGGAPSTVVINNAGTGYAAQDLLTLNGGNQNFQILVLTVNGSGVIQTFITVTGQTGTGYSIATYGVIGGHGTGATFNVTALVSALTTGTVTVYQGQLQDQITYNSIIQSPTAGQLLGVPTTGTGAIAGVYPVGTNVWSSPHEAQPFWYTIANKKARLWPLPDDQFVGQDVIIDYYTVATSVAFESDIIDADRYDMVKHWLLWKAKSYTRNNGKDDMQDADYVQFTAILAAAIRMKPAGQKFKWSPKINQIKYPGRRASRNEAW